MMPRGVCDLSCLDTLSRAGDSVSLSLEVARVFGEVGCAFYEDDDEGGRRVR